MLALQGASFAVGGATLVADADLTLRPGHLLALVGPNGAGKSTLLRLLSGELRPTRGDASIDGRPLAALGPRELARRRAVLPQNTIASFGFAALDVVMMGQNATPAHRPDEPEAAQALATMAELDVAHLARRDIRTLSGGEQQRVQLCRVLLQARASGGYLLLDEPTSSLDVAHQFATLALLRREAVAGRGVLVVLHDLNMAAAFADEIAVASRGRLVALGAPAVVLEPAAIQAWFGVEAQVTPHPHHGGPMVVFCGPGEDASRDTAA